MINIEYIVKAQKEREHCAREKVVLAPPRKPGNRKDKAA